MYKLQAGHLGFDSGYHIQNGTGAHSGSYPVGIKTSFSRVKQVGNEIDHSPSSSAEVKNVWSITPLPHMSSWHGASVACCHLCGMCLVLI
jgi:hypothetical protein